MNSGLTKKEKKKLKQQQKEQEQREENTHNQPKPQIKGNSDGNKAAQQPNQEPKKSKQLPKQKQQHNEQSGNQDSNEYNLDFNNRVQGENVEVSFLISELGERQYHSMKTILEKLARITGVISSEWADAILANPKGGNSVLADDEEEYEQQEDEQSEEEEEQPDDEEDVCHGVINLLPHRSALAKKIVEKVAKQANSNKQAINGSDPKEVITKNSCSFLICERAINLPAFVVQSMHQVLAKDLKQVKKSSPQEYAKICGSFIVGLGQIEVVRNPKSGQIDIEESIFTKFEDYLFIKHSCCWWVGESSPNSVKKVPLHKLYYVMKAEEYFAAVAQIHTLIDQQ